MPSSTMTPWHTLDVTDVLTRLHADARQGLSHGEAAERLLKYGPNELQAGTRSSPLRLLLSQFANILVVILLVAIVLSLSLGHIVEGSTIGVIALFSILLGFIQEYKAERAIEALRTLSAPTATVMRDGEEMEIIAGELVPGDIIVLEAGDKVPADARIIESVSLQADESPLTGESVPVEKKIDPLKQKDVGPGDQSNMTFMGTAVTFGRGSACVVATGMQTEFGKIAGLLESVEITQTPLQKNLDRVGRLLALSALLIVVSIVALGYSRGQPVLELFLFGIALAVAVVPEALPAVVTISLALGVQRMVKRNALVRRLPVVETLGSTTIICTDKTGTLTKGEMTVRQMHIGTETIEVTGEGYEPRGMFLNKELMWMPTEHARLLLTAATLCSDSHLVEHEDGSWMIRGDPTEGALVVAAEKAGINKHAEEQRSPRIAEIPFTSESKRMTTLHRFDNTSIAYTKGAPEVILACCSHEQSIKGPTPLTAERRQELLLVSQGMAKEALRVIAVSMRRDVSLEETDHDGIFLGLFGLIDPPRAEAKEAIQKCISAGIRPIMITGDHPETATAIARELGLFRRGRVVTGDELEHIDDETLLKEVNSIEIYARVSPLHKLRIVSALQKLGHIVAMTGDGINDAPALKKADIGIAMGKTGTDVSREAAGMLLTDDNFASIVAAVEEGRGIFANIKKYLMYLLSANFGEIMIMTAAGILQLPLPLTAVQILYINLATDGLPALALAVDPPEHDLMRRPPRKPGASMFSRPVLLLMLTSACWALIVNISLFRWILHSGGSVEQARTALFSLLVLIEFFKAYNFRSDHLSAFRAPFANKWLNLAILWEILVLLIIIASPFLRSVFGLMPLTALQLLLVLVLAMSIIPVLEAMKWVIRKSV